MFMCTFFPLLAFPLLAFPLLALPPFDLPFFALPDLLLPDLALPVLPLALFALYTYLTKPKQTFLSENYILSNVFKAITYSIVVCIHHQGIVCQHSIRKAAVIKRCDSTTEIATETLIFE